MVRPHSPEHTPSGHTPVDPDARAGNAPLEGRAVVAGAADHLGPVPPDNRPTRPEGGSDEDKPDLRAFARRFGIVAPSRDGREDGLAPTEAPVSSDTGTSDPDAPSAAARVAQVARSAASLVLGATETSLRFTADALGGLRRALQDRRPTR